MSWGLSPGADLFLWSSLAGALTPVVSLFVSREDDYGRGGEVGDNKQR